MEWLAVLLELLPLAVLAGVIGLDVVSFPQVMVSRPIVAATIGGAFVGAPVAGLLCGAALECLALEALPVGASRYPEWGSSSVVAGAIAGLGADANSFPAAGALVCALMVGISTAWVGGWTMVRHRRFVAHVAHSRLHALANGSRRTIIGLQVFGLTMDLVRGSVLGLVAYVPGRMFAEWATENWSISATYTRAFVVACVAAVAASAVWKDFHSFSYTRRLFLASLAVGTVWVVIRG